ncbi:hypothetical protein [Mesorhizobium helmanticense]|uniref:Uncharacterized protein n=1 Tax=Mesorhizobium helmanticense TaxID=1776423 RepID=A0A2T4IVN7_9HYPH|nr:hypothetical protein [Mesorhizobium helmanticense]PTE09724.1 hypothetical protein C9427_13585 [Mesorhizobium helmanticense]
MLVPSLASAEAFDWAAQLQKSPRAVQAALGASARCSTASHSVPVKFIDQNTTVRADLFDPIENTNPKQYFWSVGGEEDLSIDRDDERRYVADTISVLNCILGREATVTAYTFDNRIFRIQLAFDRCASREEKTSQVLSTPEKPFTYRECDGFDPDEKDYDEAIFQTIKARNTYGYNSQGRPGIFDFRWNGHVRGEYKGAEENALFGFSCSVDRPTGARQVILDDEPYRCLIDVDNADLSHWSSTAMYEFLTPGVIFDSVAKRLTAKRVFIDMPAESLAAKSMWPGLGAMLDAVKSEISTRLAEKVSTEGAVSKILGAP